MKTREIISESMGAKKEREGERMRGRTDLIGDVELKDSGLIQNLDSESETGLGVLGEFDLSEIAFAQSPAQLVFPQREWHSLIVLLPAIFSHH